MALINKLKAIGDGFRQSRGTDVKYTLDEMAVMAAEKTGEGAIWKTTRLSDQGTIPEKYLVSNTLYFNKNITEEEVDAIYDEIVKLSEYRGKQDNYYSFEVRFLDYIDFFIEQKYLICYVDKIEKNVCIELVDVDWTTRTRLFVKKQLSEDFKNAIEDFGYGELENKDSNFVGWNPNMNEITFESPFLSYEAHLIKNLFSYNQLDESLGLYSGKLYINDRLSKEDIYNFYEANITLSRDGMVVIAHYFEGYNHYIIVMGSFDGTNLFIELANERFDEYNNPLDFSEKLLYTTTNDLPIEFVDYDGFIGWDPKLKNFDLEDAHISISNPNVNKIISTTPFEEEYDYPLEGVYLGTTIKPSSNIDMMTFIENGEIPRIINVPKELVIEVDKLPSKNIDINKLYKLPDNTSVEKPLTAGTYYKYDGQVWSELLNTVSVEVLPAVGDPNVIYAVGEITEGEVINPTLYKYIDGEFLSFSINNFIICYGFPTNPLPGKVYYYNSPTDEYNGEFRDIYIKFPEDWQDDSFSSNFNNIITLREYVASKEWDNSQTVLLYYLSVGEMPTLDENGQYVFIENLSNEKIVIGNSEELNEKIVILVGSNDDPYMLKNMEWISLDLYLSESTGYTMNYQQSVRSINNIYNTGYYKMYYTGDRPISWYYHSSGGTKYGGTIDGRNRGTYNGQAWGKHIPFHDYVICDNMNAYDENGNKYYEDCHTHRKYYIDNYNGSEHIYPYPVFIYDKAREILYSFWNGSMNQEADSMIPGPFDYNNYSVGSSIYGVYWRNARGSSTRGNIYIVEPPASDYRDIYFNYNGSWSKPVFLRSDTYQIYEDGRYNVKDYATVNVRTNALTMFNISFNSQPAPTDREALWIPTSNNVNHIELYKGELDIVSFNQRTIADSLNHASSSTFISHNEKVYEAYEDYIWIYDVNTGEKQSISTTGNCLLSKLVIVGDYLYAIGGSDYSTKFPIDLIRKINLLDGTMTSTTGKIPAWKGGAVTYKDGYIYMFGSYYDRWEPSNSQAIYKYDVANESYTKLSTTFDDYMSVVYSFIIDNKIYIVGGYSSSYSVYVFDPSDESLEKVFTFSETISKITTATLYKEYILIICYKKVYCYDYKNNIMVTSSFMYPSIKSDGQFIAANGDVIYYAADTIDGATLTKWEEYKTTKIDSGTIKIIEDEDGIPYTLRTKQYEVKIPLTISCILMGQGSSKPATKVKFKIHNGTEWVEYE